MLIPTILRFACAIAAAVFSHNVAYGRVVEMLKSAQITHRETKMPVTAQNDIVEALTKANIWRANFKVALWLLSIAALYWIVYPAVLWTWGAFLDWWTPFSAVGDTSPITR